MLVCLAPASARAALAQAVRAQAQPLPKPQCYFDDYLAERNRYVRKPLSLQILFPH